MTQAFGIHKNISLFLQFLNRAAFQQKVESDVSLMLREIG